MEERVGVILLGGVGSRLNPLTVSGSKHLLPIYDKPMFYYPLATLMSAGIRKIYLVTNPSERWLFEAHFGDGRQLGIQLVYMVQEKPLGIPNALGLVCEIETNSKILLILGDNLFVGSGLGRDLSKYSGSDGAVIFAYRVPNPQDYGNIILDGDMNVIEINEKPIATKSPFAITGMYFLDQDCFEFIKTLQPSQRGEYEITDLLEIYRVAKKLDVKILQRGTVWFDTGNIQNLFAASEYIKVMQERQNLKFGVPEEIAFRQGWIDENDLIKISSKPYRGEYNRYIESIPEITLE